VAPDFSAIQRWAASHAATVTPPVAGAASGAAIAPVRGLPREPVPAVLAAFTEVRTWASADEHINRVAWASDPKGRLLLATTAQNGIARIWDAGTGQELHTLIGHGAAIGRAEWGHARDGQLLLATGGYDGTARIWDPSTGRCLHTFISDRGALGTDSGVVVAWGTTDDGSPVLAAGAMSGTVQIWDPGTAQELSVFSDTAPDRTDGPADFYSMAWGTQADGQVQLATGDFSGGMLRVWDPGTWQPLHTYSLGERATWYSLAYGHRADGQLVLATAATDGARVWTEENGELIARSLPTVADTTYAARWAPLADGRALLATVTGIAVHLWDGHTLDKLHTEELDSRENGCECLDWTLTPDGRLLLAVASDGDRIHIWEAVLDPPVRPPAAEARYSPASAREVPRGSGLARFVLPPREVTPPFPDAAQFPEVPTSLACVTTPDGRTLIATTSEGADVQLWELNSGRHLRTLSGHSMAVRDAAWAPAPYGRLLLATASLDRTVRIWDPVTGRELRTLTGHADFVDVVAWGTRPDGTFLLATGSDDGTARIWDPATGQELQTLTGHGDFVYAVAWSTRPDGTMLLATGSFDHTARIWDPVTGQVLQTLTGHDESVDAVTWLTLPDGTGLLATGSPDGTTRFWDPASGAERYVLPKPGQGRGPGEGSHEVYVTAWARAADGRLLLATAGSGRTAQIWDLTTEAELASLPGTRSQWRSAAWARDREGNLLLVLANPDSASGPVRAWLVETGSGGQTRPRQPSQPGTHRASRQLLRLGATGLWLPLGLLADLVTLTGTEDTPPHEAPGAVLHDARLAVLDAEPGIGRLRELVAGQPRWNPDARAAFAAMLTSGLEVPAWYTPPDDADLAGLATELAAALAGAPGIPAASWQVPVAALKAATTLITAQAITLLQILGPDACAADPMLPLRLVHRVAQLPALSPRELRVLASAGGQQPPSAPAVAQGTLTYSPGTVGVTRSGPPTRLLPTQLALPADLRTTRLAENQLLYRQHRAPAPPTPCPVTLILDTTPPTYGPAGTTLRLAAHLITTTLWAYGHHPALITLSNPATATHLHTPADLITIWTAATLDDPGPPLTTARRTAAALGQPALLLTHRNTARDIGYALGPGNRLLTTHQPPEMPPADPASPWHTHLPPAPTQAQLTTAITRILTPSTEDGR
jgi:WD40 repeat protein